MGGKRREDEADRREHEPPGAAGLTEAGRPIPEGAGSEDPAPRFSGQSAAAEMIELPAEAPPEEIAGRDSLGISAKEVASYGNVIWAPLYVQ